MRKYIILLLVPILFLSCKSKLDKELDLLQAYLDENNIDAEPTASGLYYIETLAGTGESPSDGDEVTVNYTGKFLDGETFQSKDGITFTLGQVIKGWNEGLTYMKTGGKATLITPSTLAYGPSGSGDIPGYSTLIFDIELLEIN